MRIEENDEKSMEEVEHKVVGEIAPMLEAIDELAYMTYKPMVEDICSRQASEEEVLSISKDDYF